MHSCPNCGYCPHCGRSDTAPLPMRPAPYPWRPEKPWEVGKPIHIAPYPGWGGPEVGDVPFVGHGEARSTVTGTVSYL